MPDSIENLLHCWLPYKLVYDPGKILVRWLYVNNQPFTDPFFDETIAKCRGLAPNSKPYKSVSETEALTQWSHSIDSVEPTAFIFHISRCGSTLVSQALGLLAENISLSEVPFFDEILRMPFKQPGGEKEVNNLLAAAIKFYGAKRNGKERSLFIKTDSWHLLFYKQLRALYPSTPFIILYRKPVEVLFSQQRQKGMHAVRGVIEPAVFGFDEALLNNTPYDDYMSLVLEKYYQVIIEIITANQNVLPINYNQGISDIMKQIARFTGMELSNADKEMVAERSRYHGKKGEEIFEEKYPAQPVTSANMNNLKNLYQQIEELRLHL